MTKNDDIIRIQVIDNGSSYNVETVGQRASWLNTCSKDCRVNYPED